MVGAGSAEKRKVYIFAAVFTVVVLTIVITGVILLFRSTAAQPTYTLSDQTLIISGQFGRTIDLSGASVEHRSDGVPVTPIHTNGAGLRKTEKGMFSLGGTDVYKSIMDNSAKQYILITDRVGRQYNINCKTTEQTRELYNSIVSHQKES